MKVRLLIIYGLCSVLGLRAAESIGLQGVEIEENGTSSQAHFTFTKQFTYEKVASAPGRLSLFFPGLKLGSLDEKKLSSLKVFEDVGGNQLNLVRNARLYSATHGGKSGVVLDITFTHDDAVLVKLTSFQSWKRLIVELFSKKALKEIQNSSSGPLLFTQNSIFSVKKKDHLDRQFA
jgi:hypothetical protein